VLVEVLLDAVLIADAPDRLEVYYQVLRTIDPSLVQAAVNRLAPRPAERLAVMALRFLQERILSDYAEDAKLMVRLNQVMRRVSCQELPADFQAILADARSLVADRRTELLEGIPTPLH
jgi:hypothetical protein